MDVEAPPSGAIGSIMVTLPGERDKVQLARKQRDYLQPPQTFGHNEILSACKTWLGRVPGVGVRSHREPSLAEAQAVATVSAAGSMV